MQREHTSAGVVAVSYAAKSTEDTRGSIPDQLDSCRKHAEQNGWTIAAEYLDEAASGYSASRGPGLEQAKRHAADLAASGHETVLLVYATDRLARGDGERAMHLVEHWLDAKRAGYGLRAVTESLDDLLHAALLGERAHADSKAKSAWTSAGLRRAVVAGRYLGPRPPYGYLFVGQREQRRMMPDEAQAAIVRRIFAEYVEGAGCDRIAWGLNQDGVRPQRAATWERSSVARVLDSPAVVGLVRLKGETFPGEHEPIVDRELWVRAQELRAARRDAAARGSGRLPSGGHLFVNGLLRCECGAAMRARTWKHGDPLGTGYVCSRRNRQAARCSCRMPQLSRQALDDAFLDYLSNVVFDAEETRRQLDEARERRVAESDTLLADAEEQLARSRAARERVDRDYLAGALPPDAYGRLHEMAASEEVAASAEAEQRRARADAIREEVASIGEQVDLVDRVAALRAALAGRTGSAETLEGLRAAVAATFERVTVSLEDDQIVLEPLVRVTAIAGWADWTETPEGPRARAVPRRLAIPGVTEENRGTTSLISPFPTPEETGTPLS